MSDTCETVKVASAEAPGGFFLLNASDFNAAIHKLWVAVEKTAEEIAAEAEKLALEAKDEAERLLKLAFETAPRDENGLRLDGPTPAEWLKAGYAADNYPPEGYAAIPDVVEKPVGWGAAPPA